MPVSGAVIISKDLKLTNIHSATSTAVVTTQSIAQAFCTTTSAASCTTFVATNKPKSSTTSRKKVHFTKALHSIREYFPPNDVIIAIKGQSQDVSELRICGMLPANQSIVHATKANIDACINTMSGRKLSCGSYTLHAEDLLSLMPGKYLSDNVSS